MTALPAQTTLAFLNLPGGWEWIIILMIGLLLFGRRLPEVGRSIGRSIVEFKRGIKDIENDVEDESNKPSKLDSSRSAELPDKDDDNPAATRTRERETVERND